MNPPSDGPVEPRNKTAPTPPPTRPRHLSPSSASLFEDCPRRWRFRYVEKLPEPPSEPALVGSFAHEVLEHLCGLPPGLRSQDQAKALARQLWGDFTAKDDFVELALDEDDQRAFRWKAWQAVEGLWTLEDPARVDVVSTERKVGVDLAGVPFFGIVDRVESEGDSIVISDYKSGSVPKPRYREDKVHQVMLYAAAIEASDGVRPERTRLLYLGQQALTTTVTDRKIEEAVGRLAATWTGIGSSVETDSFTAKTGPLCGWCPFVERCDQGLAYVTDRFNSGRLQDHAPAQALFT